MKHKITIAIAAIIAATTALGATTLPEAKFGVESTSSDYMEEIYAYTNLTHYLDQKNIHITYQSETTGEYDSPDRKIFSVDGSSFRWNKYYIDGFRIDSRYFAGSSIYHTDMSGYDLSLDYLNSTLRFESVENMEQSIGASYNVGYLGGISRGTSEFIRLLHETAPDRAYKPINDRSHIKGAGTLNLNFAVGSGDEKYMQSAYINIGQRQIVGFDQTGITGYYPENYATIQLGGELPPCGSLFDTAGYFLSFSQRDHLNSEFYFSEAETAALKSYNASIYGAKRHNGTLYTTGLTLSLNNTQHEDLNYSRNIIDHDSEGFDPWQPDGSNIEFSHSIAIERDLNEWLTLKFDGYNSLLRFNTAQESFQNRVYKQLTEDENPTNLYLYEWQSNDFYSALLENCVSLSTEQTISPKLDFAASVGLSLDAMLVGGSSKLSPNMELRASLNYRPTKWLQAGLNLSRERVNYNIDDIRFLSNDYLSGKVYYLDQSGNKGDLMTTTGGEYHTLSSSARQPTYYVVDIPINLTLGRHNLYLLHTYRKYCDNWTVGFDGEASQYGYYESAVIDDTEVELFYLKGNQQTNYTVGGYPDGVMSDSFFNNTPFFFCSNVEYSYTGRRFTFSLGWQSYMVGGISSLGSGPLHNNMGSLSESSANPNTSLVLQNSESDYQAVGRLDQDRAYIARIFMSYRVTDKLTLALNAKFKDGQPFSIYQTQMNSANDQLAIVPRTSRGINTTDGNFGAREDGVYNVDVRAKYDLTIAKRRCELGLYFYNVYDFSNELTEYTFVEGMSGSRNAMSLTIPRGMILSFNMKL